MELPFAESWKIKMVEPIRKSTRAEREQWIKEANYNVFQLKADQVYIDGLTDSGTGAMSDRQWAALMMGDESYAGARSFYELKDTITRITGFEYVIPTHQGRAAENVLFSALVKEGDVVPGNSHFDTTKGHIESRRAMALDCTVGEAKNTQLEVPFKGNVDPKKLEKALEDGTYQEKLETETVYSVDISWGSMEFVYAKEGTGVWNPETHSYDNVSGAGWQYPAGGPGGLAGNEVQITNHSNTKIVCSLDFTTEEAFPEIVGTFDRPEISISSAEGKAVDDETLTQKSKLNMQGALAEQVVTPTPIGEILVTLQE